MIGDERNGKKLSRVNNNWLLLNFQNSQQQQQLTASHDQPILLHVLPFPICPNHRLRRQSTYCFYLALFLRLILLKRYFQHKTRIETFQVWVSFLRIQNFESNLKFTHTHTLSFLQFCIIFNFFLWFQSQTHTLRLCVQFLEILVSHFL